MLSPKSKARLFGAAYRMARRAVKPTPQAVAAAGLSAAAGAGAGAYVARRKGKSPVRGAAVGAAAGVGAVVGARFASKSLRAAGIVRHLRAPIAPMASAGLPDNIVYASSAQGGKPRNLSSKERVGLARLLARSLRRPPK